MRILFYLFLDSILHFIHNIVAFTVISLVSPLSYSIANSTKRIVIIGTSLIILQNPVTTINCLGMSLALLGVMLYNKVSYSSNFLPLKREKSICSSYYYFYSSTWMTNILSFKLPCSYLILNMSISFYFRCLSSIFTR